MNKPRKDTFTFIKPKKSLGQHFLTDLNTAQKIVNSLLLPSYEAVVEIGPGKGVLTQYLVQKSIDKLILVEIDPECIEYLELHFNQPIVTIIKGDFLKMEFSMLDVPKISIIGNFPYNISSQILFWILRNRNQVDEIVCMVQKEVADRICSKPGSKEYGILSVLLQAYFNVKSIFTVNPGVFFPPPKVKSAVIRLIRNQVASLPCDEDSFIKIVKQAFNQRRKMLRNSLHSFISEGMDDPLFTKRPEQLDVEQFVYLTNFFNQSGQ